MTRKWPWLMGGWVLHIIIDIPTHTKAFFATPFLWPLSNFKIDGISWGTLWFMLINYSALVLVYLLIVWKRNRIKKII